VRATAARPPGVAHERFGDVERAAEQVTGWAGPQPRSQPSRPLRTWSSHHQTARYRAANEHLC
jgi:hypothetical protein